MASIQHARTVDRQCRHQNLATPDEVTDLSASVGAGGVNRPADVSAVQFRLNCVSAADGGPTQPLDVDGACGSLTKAAVLRFQRRYPGELLADGRIDVRKKTWKKLVALSDGTATAGLPKAPTAAAAGPPTNADAVMLLNAALFLSQHRLVEAIRALDVAAQEVVKCEARTFFHLGPKPLSLFQAFQELQGELKELPTVDRCFHIAGPQMTAAGVKDTLRRVRKVYVDMFDVIVRNNFTTPAAEKSGTRRFIRIVSDQYMKHTYPPGGAIASAPEGGWWTRNANVFHLRYNAAHVNDGDVITSLIHEMSHFVSHHSSFAIGGHHPQGLYNGAFNDTHAQAVRNSFCYEWYAFLASFKQQRSTANSLLNLT
jgi:hypothetical protein